MSYPVENPAANADAFFAMQLALGVDARPRLLAALGSSSIARSEDGSDRTWSGIINAANIMSEGYFYCPQSYNRAVSGAVTSAMLASQLPEVLALNPRPWGCFVYALSNDLTGGTAWATTQANVLAIIDALLAVGIRPIIGVPQPVVGFSASIQRRFARAADWVRELGQSLKGISIVDPIPLLIDKSLTTYETLSGYMEDLAQAVHLNTTGTQIYAKELVRVIKALGGNATIAGVPRSNGDLYDAADNLRGSLVANPMLTGAGGTVTSPATGTVADGWSLSPAAVGGTVAISGNVITFGGSATASGNSIVLYRDLSSGERAAIAVNDTLEMLANYTASDMTGVAAIQADLRTTMSGVTEDDYDGLTLTGGNLALAHTGILRPVPRLITSAPSLVRLRLLIVPLGGDWSGTVTFDAACLRKTA